MSQFIPMFLNRHFYASASCRFFFDQLHRMRDCTFPLSIAESGGIVQASNIWKQGWFMKHVDDLPFTRNPLTPWLMRPLRWSTCTIILCTVLRFTFWFLNSQSLSSFSSKFHPEIRHGNDPSCLVNTIPNFVLAEMDGHLAWPTGLCHFTRPAWQIGACHRHLDCTSSQPRKSIPLKDGCLTGNRHINIIVPGSVSRSFCNLSNVIELLLADLEAGRREILADQHCLDIRKELVNHKFSRIDLNTFNLV